MADCRYLAGRWRESRTLFCRMDVGTLLGLRQHFLEQPEMGKRTGPIGRLDCFGSLDLSCSLAALDYKGAEGRLCSPADTSKKICLECLCTLH